MRAARAPILVFGHRNPDADAICSALGYADFKRRVTGERYQAARCGNSNVRIDAILQRFGVSLPPFIADVTPRLGDQMARELVTASPETTCAEALRLIEHHDIQALPVVVDGNRLQGVVTIFHLGQYFLPPVGEPRQMRRVRTSMRAIVSSLGARVLHLVDEMEVEDLYVRVGAMDIRTFEGFTEREEISPERSVIVVGDRRDIQESSIRMGVRLLVVTGGLSVAPDVVEAAREAGVGLVVSPYDSATTAWTVRSATTIESLMSRDFVEFRPEDRVREVVRRTATMGPAVFMVTTDEGRLAGVFTRRDILRPSETRIILVDHNELTQAVPGAGEVDIVEVVDHHRLGDLRTRNPILFLNRPVGSTSTIVADLYRQESLEPPREIAGVLLGGLVADTLNLRSPTTTPVDREVVTWLEGRAGITGSELAEIVFSSGSVILQNIPGEVVRQDRKVYEESGWRFSISQVEEVGFEDFWSRKLGLVAALEEVRDGESLDFAVLLVTDVKSQDSLLVYRGRPDLLERITYPVIEDGEVFELEGVVSRKKQLLPFLAGVISGEHARQDGGGA